MVIQTLWIIVVVPLGLEKVTYTQIRVLRHKNYTNIDAESDQ